MNWLLKGEKEPNNFRQFTICFYLFHACPWLDFLKIESQWGVKILQNRFFKRACAKSHNLSYSWNYSKLQWSKVTMIASCFWCKNNNNASTSWFLLYFSSTGICFAELFRYFKDWKKGINHSNGALNCLHDLSALN